MSISEKVAYLRGLAEGIGIEIADESNDTKDTKEGRLLTGILDVLSDIATAIDESQATQDSLFVYAEELDEDLGIVERAFLSSERKRGRTAFDIVGISDEDEYMDDDTEDNAYGDFADLEGAAKMDCPKCGELLMFDLDDISDGGYITCPKCDAELSVVGSFSSDGDDGCGGNSGCGDCRTHSHIDEDNDGNEE